MKNPARPGHPPGGVITGHVWHDRPGLSPRLLTAMDVVDRPIGQTHTYRHGVWSLDYAFTDAGVFRVGSPTAPLETRHANLLRLMAPGTFRWYDLRRARPPVHAAYLMFNAASDIGLTRLTDDAGYLGVSDPTGELGALMTRAAQIGQRRREAGFWAAQAVLMELLDRIGSQRHAAPPAPDALAQDVRRVIQQRYAERLTLARIADAVNVSVSTLTHAYHKSSGQTPIRTLLEVRVRAAMFSLLRGRKLAAIAPEVGFADAFHLSRTFKRCTGYSPRQWLTRQSG